MARARTTSIYTRDEGPPYRYHRVKEGSGHKNRDIKGPFHVRPFINGKQVWKMIEGASTFAEAKEFATKNVAALEAQAQGLTVAEAEDLTGGVRLSEKAEKYVAEIRANKPQGTAVGYANSVKFFLDSCPKKYLTAITREDLLAYKNHLRERMSERSVYNNFLNVTIFLKWAGTPAVSLGVKKSDWPEKVERDPEEYTEKELEALFKAANDKKDKRDHQTDEFLLLSSFLCSGLRSGEMANLTYGDIDFDHSIWMVRAKRGWKTKTKAAQREVPVAEWVTKKILDRMKIGHHKNADLIFPNTKGKPDDHLIRVVQRVAKRAGLTCRVDDHKFRATTISRWLRGGMSVPDVMKNVGHTDPKIIMRYAARLAIRNPENRRKAEAPFAQFSSMGG